MTCRMRFAHDSDKLSLVILGEKATPILILKLQEHDAAVDKFTIIGERLFKIVSANEEVMQYEESILKSFDSWNAMFETEVIFKNGKFYIEILDTLAILVDNLTEILPTTKNLRNRYLCFYDDQKNIVLLRDVFEGKSGNFLKVA